MRVSLSVGEKSSRENHQRPLFQSVGFVDLSQSEWLRQDLSAEFGSTIRHHRSLCSPRSANQSQIQLIWRSTKRMTKKDFAKPIGDGECPSNKRGNNTRIVGSRSPCSLHNQAFHSIGVDVLRTNMSHTHTYCHTRMHGACIYIVHEQYTQEKYLLTDRPRSANPPFRYCACPANRNTCAHVIATATFRSRT